MRLKVKIRNTAYKFRNRYARYMHIPEFETYEGRVVKPKPYGLSANEFALTTGDYDSPVRILDKRDIVEAWVARKEVNDGVCIVPGETSAYVVTRGPINRYSCTCTAYRYRAKCSHIDAIAQGVTDG